MASRVLLKSAKPICEKAGQITGARVVLKSTTRNAVTTCKGEILPTPEKTRFGLVKVFAVSIPGILVGATLAKNGAAWLEENEIFIPDDDDDD